MVESLHDVINLKLRINPLMPDSLIALREVRAHKTSDNFKFMFLNLDDDSTDGEVIKHPNEVIASPKIAQKIIHLKEKSLL